MTSISRLNHMRFLVLAAGVLIAAVPAFPVRAADARDQLTYAKLMGDRYGGEIDLSAYAPPADAIPPSQVFEGSLKVSGKPRTRTVHADPKFLSPAEISAARTFPADFDYEFVQDGNVLLPVRRGYIVSAHPYWDVILEPGRVWNEPGDHGYTRAALPFALVQKQENCTSYGVMMFLFKSDGSTSHAAIQIGSETCNYLKIDMWGMLAATYVPHPVADKRAAVAAYRENVAHRLPERPIAQLATDYPGVDVARLKIGEDNARTLYGLVVNGVNYVSPCATRYGDYPYCDTLAFPSYSTAKTAVAALGLMAVARQYPEVPALTVPEYAPVPGCRDAGWKGVTFRDLLDMTTGHYDSAAYMADEYSDKIGQLLDAPTEQGKATFSCDAYPRKAAPGTTWVYHTADTFLLGDELNRFWRSRPGNADADVFRDVLVGRIYGPLHLSATTHVTRRTGDAAAQAFFGYGMQFDRDDIARLALFIAKDHGRIDGAQVLEPKLLDQALQRVADRRGAVVTSYPDYRYQLGFWARDIASLISCPHPVWVPFMSGWGGVSVVMYPNGVVYYNVSDSGTLAAFNWGSSAVIAGRAGGGMCH